MLVLHEFCSALPKSYLVLHKSYLVLHISYRGDLTMRISTPGRGPMDDCKVAELVRHWCAVCAKWTKVSRLRLHRRNLQSSRRALETVALYCIAFTLGCSQTQAEPNALSKQAGEPPTATSAK